MNRVGKCVYAGLMVFSLVLLAGCAERFTYQNFRTLQEGVDTQDDVEIILGTGHLLYRGDREMIYEDSDRAITANFEFDEDGVMVSKLWSQAGGPIDEGTPVEAPGDENVIHRETTIRQQDRTLD